MPMALATSSAVAAEGEESNTALFSDAETLPGVAEAGDAEGDAAAACACGGTCSTYPGWRGEEEKRGEGGAPAEG